MRISAMASWTAACVLLGLSSSCGGSTNRNANEGSAGSARLADGGSASGGATNGRGGTDAAAATDSGGAAPDRALDAFDTPDTQVSIGLWMGFPGNSLPVGMPPVAHDGSALHLAGTTNDAGLDVFFHTPLAFEKIFRGVRFWVQSDKAGSMLTVAVAGPDATYFMDRAQGLRWPEQLITVSREWTEVVIDLQDWGLDAQHLSPHSEPYGAFHFIIEPNTEYDLWIDDFAGQPR